MPVIKNGSGTGSTLGWVNGLKTLARHYPTTGPSFDTLELTIIPYSEYQPPFAARGDSGSAVLDREGRLVGMITGGTEGVREIVDLTYVTPFCHLESRIKEVFPDYSLYPPVDDFYW
jgi:hypothetical protein